MAKILKTKIAKYPFVFQDEFQLQVIHTNPTGEIISAYKYLGKGNVGTMVLESTYKLLLKGKTREYQQLWSELISTISKKEVVDVSWKESPMIAIKDQPYEFTLKASISKPEIRINQGYRIAMQQDIDIPNVWTGITYPKKLGWSRISVQQDTTSVLDYFVADTIAWKAKSLYDKILKNSKFFNRSSKTEEQQSFPLEPINLIWVYIFFLLCMGYLWLEPKIGK
ncbi:hypothetical protein [Aquimarina sp. MMG016]|uniref:hypothetical protein n=1 Tax=Aquimarina sp. MMG016 TaxID=2822690 RepID=UPI001B39FED4|nr:hypothetical protein [Aquimarina sp. MMG016]MBQ4820580.1 hypothetical protein [Aquimarina sp. MMG016]